MSNDVSPSLDVAPEPLPYYRWYVQDWRADRSVQRIGYIARGLYRELLDEQWREGSLPDCIEDLAATADCPVEVMQAEWSKLEPFFPIGPDGRRANAKLERMRTEIDAWRVSQAESGRAGGLAKARKSGERLASATERQATATERLATGSRSSPENKSNTPPAAPSLVANGDIQWSRWTVHAIQGCSGGVLETSEQYGDYLGRIGSGQTWAIPESKPRDDTGRLSVVAPESKPKRRQSR